MIAQYDDGAVHNDRHKEINIQVGCLSPDALSRLIVGFMDDGEEPPVAEEADFCPSQEEPAPQGESASQEESAPQEESAGGEAVPPELSTEKARRVLEGLQRIGVLDGGLQPVGLSWAERGYLARQIAYKLGIEHQWKVFGQLWNSDASALRSGYNRAREMPKMADFERKIKGIVG